MGVNPRCRRRSTGSRTRNSTNKIRPAMVLDGLVVVAIGLGIGIWLGVNPGGRAWVLESLAYGWVPVGFWVAAVVFGLRYRPRGVLHLWRWWAVAAAVAAIAVGALSFFHSGQGLFAEFGLSGRWGTAMVGTSAVLGVAKLLAVAIITPAVLFPRRVGLVYARGFERIGQTLGAIADRSHVTRYITPLISQLGRRFLRSSKPADDDIVRSASAALRSSSNVEVIPDRGPEAVPGLPSVQAFILDELASYGDIADDLSVEEPVWQLPSLDLLSIPGPIEAAGDDLEGMARLIEDTLASHGVSAKVEEITSGPRLIRFGLSPGWITKDDETSEGSQGDVHRPQSRVRVQSILAREKDLALALKTSSIRIQPTIQGESLVGVEVPSPTPRNVGLRQLIEAGAQGGLPIAIGENITGSGEVLDLTELPHLLIAGATGTGKSVCLNSIVASLLFAKPPDQLRFLMIDPKGVELTQFDGIPHLMASPIHELGEFAAALNGLLEVMQQRYDRMRQVGVRNIAGYNATVNRPMPYLVLVVDELAELMLSGGREAEADLVRLAQMGRATGIHLVLATQRPTVDVVTGLLKANIATRIAFTVASQTDSRVVLDVPGAEDLLGKGDMLLLEKESPQPRRVQGCFVDDGEIKELVEFWRNQSLGRADV